jgi:hypothetical protein
MLFLCLWSYPPERRDQIQARFKATGGPPPEGVKMIGRWHGFGVGRGACVAETADEVPLAKWAQEWSDLMTLEIFPVLDDQNMAKLMA